MRIMGITEFKKHALQVVGDVARTKESVVVTKRGKPIAEVVPFRASDDAPVPGRLSKALVFEKDIVSPIGESEWSVGR